MKKPNWIRSVILAGNLLLQWTVFCCRSHASDGEVDLSFDPGSGVNGNVTAVLVQPDGKVVIAGHFTTVKGLARTNLARLHADGSGDATFDAGPTMITPTAVALQPDGKLFVAGPFYSLVCDEFECYEDYPATVVRLNVNGSRDGSFASATAESAAQSRDFRCLLPLSDGKILVGGNFYSINGTNRVGIARLNANGTLDTSFNTGAGPDRAVSSIALQTDGKMLIAGIFSTVDGTNRNSVARLNANGSLDPTFDAGFVLARYPDCGPLFQCFESTEVTAVTLQPDGKALVGVWKRFMKESLEEGGQSQIDDQYLVKRLNTNGGNDPSFVFTNSAQIGLVGGIIVQPDGKLLVRHGGFNTSRISRLDANGGWDNSFHPENTSGGANAAALQSDGHVLIGGASVSVDAANGQRLSRLNADGTRDTTFDSGRALERSVSQLVLLPDGKVLIGGPYLWGSRWFGPLSDVLVFTNGTNQYGRTKLNANGSWDNAPILPNDFSPPLGAMVHSEDCLSDPRYGCSQSVLAYFALAQPDGKTLIGGDTQTAITGDETLVFIDHVFFARFNADGGLDNTFNPPTNTSATAAVLQPDGKILVGGGISVNGANASVARLNPDGSVDSSFQLGQAPGSVRCLALQPDGRIVVGGADTLARLNNNGSRDLSFVPVSFSNGVLYCLALQPDGKVLVGGSFTVVNGANRHRLARLNSDGTLDNNFNPGAGPDGLVRSIAVQPDGNVIIGGDFMMINGVVRPFVARLFGADASPTLNIARLNGLMTVSWPSPAAGFVLQQNTSLNPSSWTTPPEPITDGGATRTISVRPTTGERFFRLFKP